MLAYDHNESGVKPLKSGRTKIYSRPLASKSGGAFALPALQLVPPLTVFTIRVGEHNCNYTNYWPNIYVTRMLT